MSRRRRVVTMVAMAVGLWMVLPATAEARHKIKFERIVKVGDRYNLKVQGTFSGNTLITAGARRVKDERRKYTFEYEAVVKVLKVDAKGRSIRERHKVVKFVQTKKGTRKTMLKRGTLVTAWSAGGKKKFATAQGAVSSSVSSVLGSAVDFPSSGVTIDDVFGSRRARKIGARWSINSKLALREISTIFGRKKVPAGASCTGKVTLSRRVRESGLSALELRSKMTIKGLSPLPANFTLDKALVQATNVWVLPVSLRHPPVRTQIRLLVEIKARIPGGGGRPEVRVNMRIERSSTSRIKQLRRNP